MEYARRDRLVIFLILLLAYSYVLPRWADWSQNSRLNLVRALVEQGTTRIDAYVANTGDYAEFEGHTYTDKAPGPSFVALPFYAIALPIIDHPAIGGRLERFADSSAFSETLNPQGSGLHNDKIRTFAAQYLLTVITVALPAAGLGVLFYSILALLGLGRGPRLLATLGYGLATPAATYAGNFYSHQFVAALLFGAFALLLQTPTTRQEELQATGHHNLRPFARALLFGLLCGYALISEYPSVLVIGVLGLYALRRLSLAQLGMATLGAILPLALMALYDLRSFGTILPTGYAHSALWQDQHHTGFLSVTYPKPEALWGLTFSTFRGVFIRSPWLLLALPGFVVWWQGCQHRSAWWVALSTTLALTLFYASSVMWWGGFAAGPRYIVPILPFLALAAAYGIQPLWKQSTTRSIMIGLVVLSIGLTWSEALAYQSFPPDTIQHPWTEYTLPAWVSGDIARNLGMVLGLRGASSMIPLVAILAGLLGVLFIGPQHTTQPLRLTAKEKSV